MPRNSFPLKPSNISSAGETATGLPVVQNITTAAGSVAATNPTGPQTYAVQLNATQSCYVVFASTLAGAVASATNGFLIKGTDFAMQLGISPGMYIAAIDAGTAGSLNILELTH
jgi:hypothetical protein